MKKDYILVTGANGFIGRHLMMGLNDRGYQAIALARDKAAYRVCGGELVIEGDLQDLPGLESALAGYSVSTCIHLAWEGIPDYSFEMSERNLQHGLRILKLCRDLKIFHLIISGSCWEYQKPHGKIGEDWPLGSSDPFRAAKNSFHMMAHTFCREQGILLNWLRFFYIYGPGQRRGSLLPYIVEELAMERMPALKGGANKNDFLYVPDAAEAIIKTVEKRPSLEVMNIGSGQSVRVLDVLSITAAQMRLRHPGTGLQCRVSLVSDLSSQTSAGTDFYADIQKARAALDWEPMTSLEEGIQSYIASLKKI